MKRFCLCLLVWHVTYAQGALVATLNHNDTVSIYYGASALIDAHSAAVDGDVITLSPGIFVATNITKVITLRGAGMQEDSLSGCKPTTITGDFVINIADSVANATPHKLCIEGIYHASNITYDGTIKNASFIKSRLQRFAFVNRDSKMINANFLHCKIVAELNLGYNNNSASLINCVVEDPGGLGSSSFTFLNCVIKYNDFCPYVVLNSNYENCIVYQRVNADERYPDSFIPSSCSAYNNVCPNYNEKLPLFRDINNQTNKYSSSSDVVFKTYTGQKLLQLDNETFELTDSAKVTFLGTDGTQVGIYGGALPFDLTPTVPQIKKFNVAPKSTADGKLKVDIEVSAAAEEPKW